MDRSRVAVVVEDDPDIQDAVRQVLLASGFTVHPAATGLEGVAAVRLHEPAVVTLDLTLPDIDGFEVARQVRQSSDTYIVMVTARTEELDTLLGLESGADDYLTKPFPRVNCGPGSKHCCAGPGTGPRQNLLLSPRPRWWRPSCPPHPRRRRKPVPDSYLPPWPRWEYTVRPG
ncbi:UNVERIFIED_ORG: CheY-like chemotaxis protein [Arthrobacter globiformis]|nr:CheY-like chemotaxis protein [Arthrobacter globiformis]